MYFAALLLLGHDSGKLFYASSYKECRAECVGLHLCLVPGVTEIFGYSGAQAKDIKYTNWVSMILSGLKEFSPVGGEWEQSHS